MRRLVVGTVLIAALATSACGGGASSTSAGSSPAPAGSSASAPGTPSTLGGADGCAALSKDEIAKYALYAQLFPQVRSQSIVDSLRAGSITDYTPDAFAATLEKLQFLRGRGVPGLGDPGPSLDYYARVNDALKALLAESDPVPQPAFDTYSAVVGSIPESLGKQLPINAALSELCTELE
jgi:hypothetical protein